MSVVTPAEVEAAFGSREVIPYIETQRGYIDSEVTAMWNDTDGTLFVTDRFFRCPVDPTILKPQMR